MKLSLSTRQAALALLAVFSFSSTAYAHTWAEQITLIAPNGTFVGTPGYPRGYIPREYNYTDTDHLYQLPRADSPGNAFLATDLICKPGYQTIGNQTEGYPALSASPGDYVAIRYRENGHVTAPQLPVGKPLGSGTVFVYGTPNPSNSDTYLGIHRVWNTQGTGGDGRGVLLATRPFDDGQCYQVRTDPNGVALSKQRQAQFPTDPKEVPFGTELPCQTDVRLPASVTEKSYTLYWVWEWPTLGSNGAVSTNESYTSCVDINIIPGNGSSSKAAAVNFVKGQPFAYAAISQQLASPFLINPTASPQTFGGSTLPVGEIKTGNPTAGGAAPVSSSSVPATKSSSAAPIAISASVTVPVPAKSSSSPANSGSGFATVTVTNSPTVVTVTATATVAQVTVTMITGAPMTTSHRYKTITEIQTIDDDSTMSPAASSRSSAAQSSATSSSAAKPTPQSAAVLTGSNTTITVLPIPAQATASTAAHKRRSWTPRGRTS